MIDLFEALVDRWDSQSLGAAGTFDGGVWGLQAGANASWPHVVVESVFNSPDQWSSHGEFRIHEITFHTYVKDKVSSSTVFDEVGRLQKVLMAAFDFAPLTVGSGEGTILQMRRTGDTIILEDSPDGDVYHGLVTYEVHRVLSVNFSPS